MCLVYRSAVGLNELLCGDCTKLPRPQRACSCRPKARICGRHLAAQSAGFTETAGLPAWETREPPGHEATAVAVLPKRTACDESEPGAPLQSPMRLAPQASTKKTVNLGTLTLTCI